MSLPVAYQAPRLINPISVAFVLFLAAGIYAAYQMVMVSFLRQEAYRVLEETGSKFAGRRQAYRNDVNLRESLREKMEGDLRGIGVDDPDIETWVDPGEHDAEIGVVFTAWYHWPFDVLQPIPREFQVEHVVQYPQ